MHIAWSPDGLSSRVDLPQSHIWRFANAGIYIVQSGLELCLQLELAIFDECQPRGLECGTCR